MRVGDTPRAPVAAAPRPTEDPTLRKVAQQMEGVFVQELYKAMRATVPQDEGVVGGGAGEELFTGLMDQHLATETPQAWGRGLGEAIYQHLRGRAAAEGGATPPLEPTAPHPTLAPPLPAMPLATPDPLSLTSIRDAGR